MPRPEKFPIYAYDGIPPEALVQESPLLMPRAHETKVPNFMRGCWRTWEMDQPANFTRFERCKSFIPVRVDFLHLRCCVLTLYNASLTRHPALGNSDPDCSTADRAAPLGDRHLLVAILGLCLL
jgi:hypothetical protein